MAYTVMVIDDDLDILEQLKDGLQFKGYDALTFNDAYPALNHIRTHGLPHLILVDYGLPAMTGFELSKKLSALGDIPIIFISKKNDADLIAEGIESYADDFVTKPFDLRIVLAKVQRLLSRIYKFDYVQIPLIQIDKDVVVDFGNSRLTKKDEVIALTPTECRLLHVLMRNAGRIVTSATLISRAWPNEEVYEETLRVHMHRLRKKIEIDFPNPRYIQTERGVGYRFAALDELTISQLVPLQQ
ncbi:MAG TPA: response regulator transcription factor [Aggregatilineaceae bacterium]|nr:response regulator transcription factor [Aggregatilineaceae bacterium]